MKVISMRPNLFLFSVFFVFIAYTNAFGQDEATDPVVRYDLIQPILEKNCVNCHNADDEAGGANLDDVDTIKDYIESGKPLESSLYQSILGTDGMSKMPPEEDDDGNELAPLTELEVLAIHSWISQGASFEGAEIKEKVEDTRAIAYRSFLFSGYFHPAIVHFPIALFTISAFFIIFCFRSEVLADDAAFYLLMIGTLSSIVACVFGWAFAERSPVNIWDISIGINRHRWLGIVVTVIGLIATVLGWRARNDVMGKRNNGMWKFGTIICAAIIGLVGHQGGEEVYGEGFYDKAAEKLDIPFWPFREAKESDQADGKAEQADGEDSEKNGANKDSNSDLADESKPDDEPSDGGENGSGTSEEEKKSDSPPVDPTIKKAD